MKLFLICQIPGCGSVIDEDTVEKKFNGACLTVKGHCNDGHDFTVSTKQDNV